MGEGGHQLSLHGGSGLVDVVGVSVVERVFQQLASVAQALDHRIHETRVAQVSQPLQTAILQRMMMVVTIDAAVRR